MLLAVSEREGLEAKLRSMRISVQSRLLLEMNVDAYFQTLCLVYEYNQRHQDNPILPAPEVE